MLRVHEERNQEMDEERVTVDAYAVHFLIKCVHIILTSRNPTLSITHSKALDKWVCPELVKLARLDKIGACSSIFKLEKWSAFERC